jgi:peptidyl-dipeptidase A
VPSDPAAVVAELEAGLRPLVVAAYQSWWDANVKATPENEQRRVATELARSDFLADTGAFAAVSAARETAPGDGLVRRQLDLLHDEMLPMQVPDELRRRIVELEAAVEARYAQHRGQIRGEPVDDNAILRVLRGSDDATERRQAWEASKTIGAVVAEDVRELGRLRNEAAHALGHRDWFALSLATSELDEERLFATLAEVDAVTSEPFARWKSELDARLAERFGAPLSALRPWHYDDPFFQELPVHGGVDLDPVLGERDPVLLARRTYDGLGLDIAAILERSDLYPREAKSQHAFCIDIDREGDVRVLANVEHNAYWADVMLHELGHGSYDVGVDHALPWLLRTMHLIPTEGIAMLFGRLARDREWLATVAEVDESELGPVAERLPAAQAAALLVFARWVLVVTTFEHGFYADPEADHDTRWWELVRRFQLVTPPDGRRAPDWAAKIHLAVAPVYYQNYLYGEMTASQLRATIDRECGGLVDRPEAGRLLEERVFRPGASLRWDRLLETATGEPLSSRFLAADLAAA